MTVAVHATPRTRPRVLELPTLDAYAAAWDALVAAAPLPSPFLRSWWIAGTAGPGTRLLLVLDGEELLGGVALERRRVLGVPTYRAAGGGKLCPDHVDLVAAPARAVEVAAALGRWFAAPGSRLLDVDGVAEGARLLRALPAARVERHDVAAYGALPADPGAFLAARSATFRKRVRRYERDADAAGTTCRRVSDAELPEALAQFRRLHGARPDRAALLRHADRLERTVLLAAARGELRVHVAERDGECGAVLIGFGTAGRFSHYQVARSLAPEFDHVGTLLSTAAVRAACVDGLTELDFLRGDEPYKRSFVPEERALLRVRAAHGLPAHAVLLLVRTVKAARRRAGTAVRGVRALAGRRRADR